MQKYTMLDELHSYNTRTKHKRNYFVTRVSTKQAQKCLIYVGPKIKTKKEKKLQTLKKTEKKERKKTTNFELVFLKKKWQALSSFYP